MAKKQAWWIWLLLLGAGFVLFTVLYGVASIPQGLSERFDLPLWALLLLTLAGSAVVLGMYALWWKWTRKQRPADLPMRRLLPDTGIGFGIGALFLAAVTGVIALFGAYRIGSFHWDGAFAARELLFFLVVAVSEEVIFRGIVFRMIDERWGTLAALVISALIFGFMHISNQNATVWSSIAIAVEAGLLLGAAYKWSGNLWVPIGIHWAWNWFQGPVFGFAVSGADTESLVAPVIQGSDWLTGGAFGAEASIPAFVLGLVVAIVFLWIPRRTACTSR